MGYEYDEERQVLINTAGLMQVIENDNLGWRELGPEYEPIRKSDLSWTRMLGTVKNHYRRASAGNFEKLGLYFSKG